MMPAWSFPVVRATRVLTAGVPPRTTRVTPGDSPVSQPAPATDESRRNSRRRQFTVMRLAPGDTTVAPPGRRRASERGTASAATDAADLNNDGWVDLFVANGMSRDFVNADLLGQMRERGHRGWAGTPMLREANPAFRNLGDLEFESVGPAWGLGQVSVSMAAATADLDRGDDLDPVVMNLGAPLSLLRNDGRTAHTNTVTAGIGVPLLRVREE